MGIASTIPYPASGEIEQSPVDILAAIGQLISDTRERQRLYQQGRMESRWPVNLPVRLWMLGEQGLEPTQGCEGVSAYMRDISPSGVGLLHGEAIGSRRVKVDFDLLDGQSLALVVELTWSTCMQGFAYSSGGTVQAVIRPHADAGPVPSRLNILADLRL